MRKYILFSTTSLSCKEFLVNGMTVSRISVFQYFEELLDSLCFLIALTRAHASENYFVRSYCLTGLKIFKNKIKQRNLILKTFLYYPQVRGFFGGSSQNSRRQTLMFLLKLTSGALKRNEIQLVDYSWDCQLITNYQRCVTLNGFRGNRTQQVQCYI